MDDSRCQIETLLYTYAERLDAGDFEGVAALFADASLGAEGGPAVRGRDAVLALYRATVRRHADGTPRTRHVTTNVVVEVDEAADAARARSCFTVFQQLDDFPLQAIIVGRYHDRFARGAGAWRFAERRMLLDLRGDLSRHLLIALPPAAGG